MFMITRRRLPVKQNPQSFLHCRKIAENCRKTQKRCKFNLQTGCGFKLPQSKPDGFASSLGEGAFGRAVQFPAKPQSLQACPLPLGGAVAQRLRGYGWRSEKSVKALAPTGAALAFLCFDFFFRIVKGEQPLATGCGTQHPLRALGGTRVLLAAAPTAAPCFRRWRRSQLLHCGVGGVQR